MTIVTIQTNYGNIDVELNADKAPITVANFLDYVESGFYDGTIFHRVIKGFMIQGGGMEPGMGEKPNNAQIKNEADNGLSNDIGTIAMARTMVPDSASSQFFISCGENIFLNHTSKTEQGWGYAVFGKVINGMDIVQIIEKVPTENKGMHADVPVDDVIIKKITLS